MLQSPTSLNRATAGSGPVAALPNRPDPVPEDEERWADPRGRAPSFQARYVAGLDGQASLAEPLRSGRWVEEPAAAE